jgi:hypothetical protein
MGRNPESTDTSIYSLRRRIPTRPSEGQEKAPDHEACVPKVEQHSASFAVNLISRLFPTVRLGH